MYRGLWTNQIVIFMINWEIALMLCELLNHADFVIFPQTQIHDLKQAQNTSSVQLRSTLLDPAVNLLFQRMKKELDDSKDKLEQAQNDLSAWKFTPDR